MDVMSLTWIIPLVITLVVTVGVIWFIWVIFRPMFSQMAGQSQLMRTGMDAQGKIIKIWDTGITINDNPRIGMTIEVYASDGTFQADTAATVGRLRISLYQPGAMVTVKYDPTDKTKIAVTGLASAPIG